MFRDTFFSPCSYNGFQNKFWRPRLLVSEEQVSRENKIGLWDLEKMENWLFGTPKIGYISLQTSSHYFNLTLYKIFLDRSHNCLYSRSVHASSLPCEDISPPLIGSDAHGDILGTAWHWDIRLMAGPQQTSSKIDCWDPHRKQTSLMGKDRVHRVSIGFTGRCWAWLMPTGCMRSELWPSHWCITSSVL